METVIKSMERIFGRYKLMDIAFLKNLNGMKFNKIFKQLDLFIINLGNPVKYSLHVSSMVRICYEEKIVLTASDCFFTKEGVQKSSERYKQLEEKGMLVDPTDMLSCNLKFVNSLLNNAYVKNVELTKWKDLYIYFNNNVVIQIFPDCLGKSYEYFRLINFIPALLHNDKYVSEHFVLLNNEGELVFKREE